MACATSTIPIIGCCPGGATNPTPCGEIRLIGPQTTFSRGASVTLATAQDLEFVAFTALRNQFYVQAAFTGGPFLPRLNPQFGVCPPVGPTSPDNSSGLDAHMVYEFQTFSNGDWQSGLKFGFGTSTQLPGTACYQCIFAQNAPGFWIVAADLVGRQVRIAHHWRYMFGNVNLPSGSGTYRVSVQSFENIPP